LFLVFFSGFYRGVKLPLVVLGFFFYGPSATLVFLAQIAAQIAAAVGLLKLKRWGLLATFGLQCLTLVNIVLVVAIPANRLKYQQVMDAMRSSVNARMNHYPTVDFPVWIGMASSLPIILAILWFLVAERRTFSSSPNERGGWTVGVGGWKSEVGGGKTSRLRRERNAEIKANSRFLTRLGKAAGSE
jgi:hypothetical protein